MNFLLSIALKSTHSSEDIFCNTNKLNFTVFSEVVKKESGELCGTIYCDWFDRDNKTTADSHFTIKCGKKLKADDEYQLPVVVLAFRFAKGHLADNFGPSQLSNVLHEFGHAMHSMLGRTRYQHTAGKSFQNLFRASLLCHNKCNEVGRIMA